VLRTLSLRDTPCSSNIQLVHISSKTYATFSLIDFRIGGLVEVYRSVVHLVLRTSNLCVLLWEFLKFDVYRTALATDLYGG
jgi:hypothetical protein